MTVRTMTKAQREARYPELKRVRSGRGATAAGRPTRADREAAMRPRPSRSSATHRTAVARGCPESFPVARRVGVAGRASARAEALMHRDIVAACKRAGIKARFEIACPGAVGHERCERVCVTYF